MMSAKSPATEISPAVQSSAKSRCRSVEITFLLGVHPGPSAAIPAENTLPGCGVTIRCGMYHDGLTPRRRRPLTRHPRARPGNCRREDEGGRADRPSDAGDGGGFADMRADRRRHVCVNGMILSDRDLARLDDGRKPIGEEAHMWQPDGWGFR